MKSENILRYTKGKPTPHAAAVLHVAALIMAALTIYTRLRIASVLYSLPNDKM